MPHMMPMLWSLMFMSSFLMLMLLSSMIYFFYLPKISLTKSKFYKLHKWNWVW